MPSPFHSTVIGQYIKYIASIANPIKFTMISLITAIELLNHSIIYDFSYDQLYWL